MEEMGCELGEIKGIKYEEIEERERQKQRKERVKRISESKCNEWYKEIRVEGIPKYMRKGWAEERWGRVMR